MKGLMTCSTSVKSCRCKQSSGLEELVPTIDKRVCVTLQLNFVHHIDLYCVYHIATCLSPQVKIIPLKPDTSFLSHFFLTFLSSVTYQYFSKIFLSLLSIFNEAVTCKVLCYTK